MSVTHDVPTSGGSESSGSPRGTARTVLDRLALDRFSGVYGLVAMIVLFSILLPATFPTSITARSIGSSSAVTALLALALVLPLAAGVFDLSVAANLGLSVVIAISAEQNGMGAGPAITLALASGLAIGLTNAALVVGLRIDSFIATLGMSSVLIGLAYWTTDGNPLVVPPGSTLVKLGQANVAGVPVGVLYALVIAAVVYYLTEWTTPGRYLYAVGGNKEATRLVGVRVNRLLVGALAASGVLASFAGVVLAAQLGAGSADIGPAYLLPAFSAALLGATQVSRHGRVNVPGTLVAVALLATGIYGLQLAGAPIYISNLFNGLALILAVALATRAKRS